MAFIAWLDRGRLERETVGGKGAALSDLLAAGFTVPPGFVVTAAGYRYFLRASGIEREIDSLMRNISPSTPLAARNAADRIGGLIQTARLPDDLRDEIVAAYDDLTLASGVACAVRSSAIAEDGAAASFAGLYESYLNVRGASKVVDAVVRCYASLWSERAIRYRAGRDAEQQGESMAVVVMGLVPADTAGIAFTAHPVTGDTNVVVINASWGLGEAIVSGIVTPDSFVVDKTTMALQEREIFEKELAIYPDPDGGGTVERTLPPDVASAPSLTDDQAREVAALASRVESHYGTPQDIEWAIAVGQLYLLQSRPITTL